MQCFLLVGGTDVSQEASENAAMFLLHHFKSSDQVTSVDTKILKDNFGPFPASSAEKCCEIVHRLLSFLPSGVLDRDKESHVTDAKRYGHTLKIKVVDEGSLFFDDSDSDHEGGKGDNFVNQFKEQLNIDQSKQYRDTRSLPHVKSSPVVEHKQEEASESSWLLNQCQKYFPDQESPETMATALYDVLISTKNDAEIQNELFELVGFEAFDFIGELLKRRKHLVSSQDTMNSVKFRNSGKKPLVPSQVTIQVGAFILHLVMQV